MRMAKLIPILCVLVAVWLVIVPLAALLFTAFTADAILGDGTATLQNFVEAYSGWHIARLLGNSLIYASGTAVVTLLMGGAVAWVV
jgi:iron(III) transport system permease protein